MGLTTLDLAVLLGYFVLMIVIGVWSMMFVKKQEDYFLGSRSFGKVFQMFASNKPIIFYVSATKDASLTYFEKYENFVKISQNDNDVSFLKDYIKDYYGNTFEKRNDLFTESTPEYICNIILK